MLIGYTWGDVIVWYITEIVEVRCIIIIILIKYGEMNGDVILLLTLLSLS